MVKKQEEIRKLVKAYERAIELAAQLARGAKNFVHDGYNPSTRKWAFCSKPKLNELKKALRKAGVKI